MNNLVEDKFGTGAVIRNPVHRFLRRNTQPLVGKSSVPFDWTKGYEVQDTTGAIPIKNQGSSYSCGGQAGAYLIEIYRRLLKVPEEVSAKSIYSPIAYPGGGTTVTALQQQIGTQGAALESEVPSQPNETWMTNKLWMNSNQLMSDMKRAGYAPLTVNIDMDSIAEAVRDHGALIMEIRGQNGNGAGWLSPYPTPPSKLNPNPLWAHFMCITGAKMADSLKQFNALQSWGNVGDNGKQYFRDNYVQSGHIVDVFTFVDDSTAVPTSPWWKMWIAWFLKYMS